MLLTRRLIRLSDFYTGIDAAAHGTLDTKQLIYHTRTALVVKLLTKIHDSLDSDVSKWVGIMAHILVCLFNSDSSQCCEVWALHFPFFTDLRTLFLLVRLDFMVALIRLWLSNTFLLICLSLQPM